MSFLTKAEGEVEAVVAKIEEAAEYLEGNAAKFFHGAAVAVVRDIEADFGIKSKGDTKLQVKVQADGHFDENGVGDGTIHIETSTVPANAAGETPPADNPPATPA